nr:unnamed protein product [Spirometra erinaceieuropaei]
MKPVLLTLMYWSVRLLHADGQSEDHDKDSSRPYLYELPIQHAEVDAAVDPKVQKPKSSTEEGEVAAVEETGAVAAKATITSEQAAEEVEQAQE